MSQPIAARLLLVVVLIAQSATQARADSASVDFFERKIRPVLVEHCYSCHSQQAKKSRGGLRVDSRAALLAGGDRGPALVPGQPDKSRLIEAILYNNVDLQMPPRGKLSEAVIADLTAWVKQGAPWPEEKAAGTMTREGFDLQQRKQSHWAWRPIRPTAPPRVRAEDWPRTPVDRFVLARLEQAGLQPGADADRATLLRRLSFDLVGLPPSPAELQAFLDDHSDDALARVVDRLLASPRFGEKWARHWLDLVRYAETRGHEFDFAIPNAYLYRDYVIRALNADVPYNQFVIEHLAGDLLEQPRRHPGQGFNESILGTAFWFLGEELHSPVDIRGDQADRFDNRIDVMSKTFLGLTVACARCHDHKFDAISTRDYYSLFGFLSSSSYRLARFDTMLQERDVAKALWQARRDGQTTLRKTLAQAVRPVVTRIADYLLAAQQIAAAEPTPERVNKVAQAHKLDATLLRRWAKHLRNAAREPSDPLHAWARRAGDQKVHVVAKPSTAQKPLSELSSTQVVFDAATATSWLSDGFAFGDGPARPGELRWQGHTLRFVQRAAAEFDPVWQQLTLAPGTENDPGSLGRLVRAGRTFRTPTFRLDKGKVFVLVRGAGQIYAAVGSHVMIAGPLHGRLIQNVPASSSYRWVGLDLSVYAGLDAHLEFTPQSEDFAVSQVVQADRSPPKPATPDRSQLVSGDTAEQLATAYQQRFVDLIDRLAQTGLQDDADRAALGDWMLTHQELFGLDGPAGQSLRTALAALRDEESRLTAPLKTPSRLIPALLDGNGVDERVFIRGSHKSPGVPAPRRFLEALVGDTPLNASGSGRLALARQMTDPQINPFISRVLVNRLWHHLFGRGIVASVDDFGVMGQAPSHPELLDWLADQFVRDGWSIKKMIRQLVLSRVYGLASTRNEAARTLDPDNVLLHRANVRRLSGEAIRDSLLVLSGRLDETIYGPSVPVHLTEFQQGRGRPASGPLDGAGRRSIYLAVRRNFLSPLLLAFDTPAPFSTVGKRTVSNVPAQSLILLNDPFVHQQAQKWAEVVRTAPGSDAERIDRMYLAAFARRPDETERRACLEFLAGKGKADAAWSDLAHALINVKEFIFLR